MKIHNTTSIKVGDCKINLKTKSYSLSLKLIISMFHFLKNMFSSSEDRNKFNKNIANNIVEELTKSDKFTKPNDFFILGDTITEQPKATLSENIVVWQKQDRCTFEYNVQYKALRNITMLFKNVLKEKLSINQHKNVELCIKAVRKDSDFIKNRLTEGTYDKTKGTDYDEEVLTLFASLKSLRVIRKTLFYIQENKSHELEQKNIVSKLINILNNEINSRQTMLDSLKKDLNIVVNK
jgi:hypothetical protein